MAKKKPQQKVFLDANVVISAGKPPGGPIISRVEDLVDAGIVGILTTDLTVTEVAKKHAENDYDVVKDVARPHFRDIVEEHLGAKLPKISKSEMKQQIGETYHKKVTEMFDRLKATTLPIDDVKPSTVFDDYSHQKGFFSGDGKKDQFPDAFIFEAIKAEATEGDPVIIVSEDGDFKKPVADTDHVELLESIPELFTKLGLEIEAPEVDAFLTEHDDEVVTTVNKELNDWSLDVTDVRDAEVQESEVLSVEFGDTVAFRSTEEDGDILIVGTMKITAVVSYSHPDWDNAIYDSEDKELIPFDTVDGEKEVDLEADFSMSVSVEDGVPTEIVDFQFRNTDFLSIEIDRYENYK